MRTSGVQIKFTAARRSLQCPHHICRKTNSGRFKIPKRPRRGLLRHSELEEVRTLFASKEYQKSDESLSIRRSAHMRAGSTTWSDFTMTNFKLLGVAAILSTIIANPVMAQPAVQALPQAVVQARGSYAMALASSFHPSMPGHETATRPWSAPVGHRQPRAADVPTSTSLSVLDQEDADVDRKISGVCRGC